MIARNYIVQELPEIHCNLLFSFPGGTIAMDMMISFWKDLKKISQELRMLSSVTINCHKDCHEFRFSIVRIVVSVSNVISL